MRGGVDGPGLAGRLRLRVAGRRPRRRRAAALRVRAARRLPVRACPRRAADGREPHRARGRERSSGGRARSRLARPVGTGAEPGSSRRALVARPPAPRAPSLSVPFRFASRRFPDHVRLRPEEDRRHQEPARAAPHAARGRAHQRARRLGEVALRRAHARADPRLPQGSVRRPREGEVGGARPPAARLLRAHPRGERPRAGHAPLRRAAGRRDGAAPRDDRRDEDRQGKTLVATLSCVLNSLEGKGVHVVTVNDYLARRDAEWMGRLYRALGLTTGCVVHGLTDKQRQHEYGCDITYGQNNEFGFDYLRDNMKFRLQDYVQRELHYAIVDEVDSILIDEARTPLIISGPSEESTDKYY